MNPLNLKPSMNFEPPSDFVAEGSGGKSKWKKIFGIGCGVVFLLLAIALGAGAFKVASCCGDVTNLAQKSQAVSQNAMQFAVLLQKGQLKQAHEALAPSYASNMPLPKFEAMFEPHRALLSSSVPMLLNVEPQMVPGTEESMDALEKVQKYNITIRFFSASAANSLHMAVTASVVGEVVEGQPVETQIEHVGTQLRAVNIAQEPPSLAAQRLYNDLQLKGPQGVFGSLSPVYQKNSTPEQFQTFVQEHPNLTKGLPATVAFLDYSKGTTPPGAAATVILKLDDAAAYRFELTRSFPSWTVSAIAPHELPPAAVAPKAAPESEQEVKKDSKAAPAEGEK